MWTVISGRAMTKTSPDAIPALDRSTRPAFALWGAAESVPCQVISE